MITSIIGYHNKSIKTNIVSSESAYPEAINLGKKLGDSLIQAIRETKYFTTKTNQNNTKAALQSISKTIFSLEKLDFDGLPNNLFDSDKEKLLRKLDLTIKVCKNMEKFEEDESIIIGSAILTMAICEAYISKINMIPDQIIESHFEQTFNALPSTSIFKDIKNYIIKSPFKASLIAGAIIAAIVTFSIFTAGIGLVAAAAGGGGTFLVSVTGGGFSLFYDVSNSHKNDYISDIESLNMLNGRSRAV